MFRKPTVEREIFVLKRTARANMLAYQAEVDGLNCGASLAMYISPDAREFAVGYNAAMISLKKIDPTFPANWKPLGGV
jgi:hypothetical protein